MITWLYALGILLILEYLIQLVWIALQIYIGELATKQEINKRLVPMYPLVWLITTYINLPEKRE